MTTPPVPNPQLTPEQMALLAGHEAGHASAMAQMAATPPPPPPPTPASAGFAAYAADPQNTQKIANSLVSPGQPILPPNAEHAALVASATPTQSPVDPSMPQPPPNVAAPTPWTAQPSSPPPNVAAPSAMMPPASASGAPPAAPQPDASPMVPPGSDTSVNVQGTAPFQSYDEWAQQNPDKLAHGSLLNYQKGSGWKGALKLGLGLATAGGLGAEGALHGDPGLGINWVNQQNAIDRGLPDVNQARYKAAVIDPAQSGMALMNTAAQIGERTAQTGKYNAQTTAIPQKQAAFEAKNGLVRDDQGNLAIDEDSPYAKNLAARTALDTYRAELSKINALGETPGTPEFHAKVEIPQQLAQGRLQAVLAGLGLKRESLNVRERGQEAALTGVDTKTGAYLPGTTMIANDDGTQTGVGSRNAPMAAKQQGKVGGFKDLTGSVQHASDALTALHSSGGSLSDPQIVAAMSDPHSMVGKIVNGNMVQGGLTPVQLEAINSVRQLHEQAGILRSSTGGTSSEAQSQRILDTVPVAGDSPDMAMSKLQEVRGVLGRLTPSVSTVSGGLTVNGKGSGAKSMAVPPTSSVAPTGLAVKMSDARALPQNKGKSDDQIRADIQAHGHAVTN